MTTTYLAAFSIAAACVAVWLWVQNEKLKLILKSERAAFEQSKKLQQEFAREFENISNRVVKGQREDFANEQRASLASLLNPFAGQLKDFREMVERANHMGKEDKGRLSHEIESLKNMGLALSKNADDLARALKGNSKIQGDWGEQQLKTILDMAGLAEGINYDMQANVKGEGGANLRPDCVVNLPNGRRVVIDAKVSLTNYIDYVRDEDAEAKKRHIDLHVKSVKAHISELAKKEYQKYVGDGVDFVFMFIPNEHAYIEALKSDGSIYDGAYKSNIAIVTPSSILPVLRTVRNLWNIEKQNQNASLISERAGRLYDKLAGFVENMKKIDRSITGARSAYDDAFGQLSDGRGSALSIAEDLKEMGAKTAKSIQQKILP